MATWIIQTLIVIALAVIGYLLKDLKKGIESKISGAEQRIAGLEVQLDKKLVTFKNEFDKRITNTEQHYETLCKDFNDYKDQVNKNFTLKDDFVRAVSNIDRKLDKITELIIERRASN